METIALLTAVAVMVVALGLVYTRRTVARRLAPTADAAGPMAAQLVVVAIFTATAAVAAAMTPGPGGQPIAWNGPGVERRLAAAMAGSYPVPDKLNWDLFLGPAPMRPFNQKRFAYYWHWFCEPSCCSSWSNPAAVYHSAVGSSCQFSATPSIQGP